MLIWRCGGCPYRYVERVGDSENHIPPGTPFGQIPPGWRCPRCGSKKEYFTIEDDGILRF